MKRWWAQFSRYQRTQEVAQSNCRSAVAESFNNSSACFMRDLWVSQEAPTLQMPRRHVGSPPQWIFCILGNAPLPDLGPSNGHVHQATTPQAGPSAAASSLVTSALQCTCKPPAHVRSVGRRLPHVLFPAYGILCENVNSKVPSDVAQRALALIRLGIVMALQDK
jgi:hypothetical protein